MDAEMPEIQDEFNVEMGTPFDYIFKERAELIDSQKQANNKKMDELVAALGYMDYRDALACNKYIIEAKRSGDYHQIARGRLLEQAFNRLNNEKKAEIRKKANQNAEQIQQAQQKSTMTPESLQNLRDQERMKLMMDEDAAIAGIYQETYS